MPFTFARSDMNRPFRKAASHRRVRAGPCRQRAARRLTTSAFTLAEIRTALAQDGVLVATECVRRSPGQPIYIEFVFNLLEKLPASAPRAGVAPQRRLSHPGAVGRLALEANGFRDVAFFPRRPR
jgi:hypothetical protein